MYVSSGGGRSSFSSLILLGVMRTAVPVFCASARASDVGTKYQAVSLLMVPLVTQNVVRLERSVSVNRDISFNKYGALSLEAITSASHV